MSKVCFNSSQFLSFIVIYLIIFLIITFVLFIYFKNVKQKVFVKNNISRIQEPERTPEPERTQEPERIQERIPERTYIGPRDYQNSAIQVGFIYNNQDRYALFQTRISNKYYYHVIDDTRFGIRIIINSKKNEQLFDGDDVYIPELNSSFKIKLYDYVGNRYIPYI